MQRRNNSYDVLRILCTFAVILIHVNAAYLSKNIADGKNGIYVTAEQIINVMTRFSVPCFVMISGAFNLNAKNREYKGYYKKIWKKTVFPFLAIAAGMLVLSEIAVAFGFMYSGFLQPLHLFFKGAFMNWWFMYMIFGLYIFTPVILRFKESVSTKAYKVTACVWLIFSIVSQSTTIYNVAYSFGIIISYIGYYMLGNVIYEQGKQVKKPWILLAAAVIILVLIYYVRELLGITLYTFDAYASFFSPGVVTASVLIFTFFSCITIKGNLTWLSGLTYYIYLFHTLVYSVILALLGTQIIVNELATVVLVTFLAFVISGIAAYIFKKVWQRCCG